MEAWQSPVYCNSLENCRVEMLREFESHRFRQNKSVRKYDKFSVSLSCTKPYDFCLISSVVEHRLDKA